MSIQIKISGIGKNSCVNLKGADGSIQTFTDKTKSIKVEDITIYTQGIEALKGMGLKVETKEIAERVRGGNDKNEGDKNDHPLDEYYNQQDASKDDKNKAPEGVADVVT